jgi:uncharacterized protein YunC (DUF1805 family)
VIKSETAHLLEVQAVSDEAKKLGVRVGMKGEEALKFFR